MTTTTTTTEVPEATPAQEHSANALEHLRKYRKNIEDLLLFADCNAKQLSGLEWDPCHIYCKIEIMAGPKSKRFEREARLIARRWPGVVWTRRRNDGVCGVLDWHGTVDGIPVIIRNAEGIKWSPMPNTEVEA
jgi:hypothetical protein